MLLQNASLQAQYPYRLSGGGIASGSRANFGRADRLNQYTAFDAKAATPNGHLAPSAWVLPMKPGGMASRNEGLITFAATGNAAQGRNLFGDTAITLVTSGAGQAIASASGTASIIITTAGTAVAPLNATGSATITFTGAGVLIAPSAISGSSSITITPNATLRADGFMIAVPISTALTVDQIVAGVWNAVASAYNISGTMGEKLNDAGAAGNPWAALTADNIGPDTFGKLVQDTLKQAKLAAALSA